MTNPDASAAYSNLELFEKPQPPLLFSVNGEDIFSNILSYGGIEQDLNPDVQIDTINRSVKITGNGWKYLPGNFNITPDIVVSASHFGRIPNPLEFVTENGTVITRSVVEAVNVGTDVRVSRLNEPLPSEVKIYQLPDPSISYSELVGGLSIYTNRGRTAHAGTISPSFGSLADLNRDSGIPNNLWDELEGGDSGSPGFIIMETQIYNWLLKMGLNNWVLHMLSRQTY